MYRAVERLCYVYDHLLFQEAFAVVREASKRVLGLRPFDVQLIGNVSFIYCPHWHCRWIFQIDFIAPSSR